MWASQYESRTIKKNYQIMQIMIQTYYIIKYLLIKNILEILINLIET